MNTYCSLCRYYIIIVCLEVHIGRFKGKTHISQNVDELKFKLNKKVNNVV